MAKQTACSNEKGHPNPGGLFRFDVRGNPTSQIVSRKALAAGSGYVEYPRLVVEQLEIAGS